jgi:aminoglycoside phosphotransferase (APT) family kinase protein
VLVMRRVAAALAALHRSELQPARRWRIEEEAVKLGRTRQARARFYPMLQPQVDSVLARLQATAPAEATRLVPVHGDFHCNQVLVDADRVAVIDFDLFGLGDPLHDVARFLSRFRAYAHGKLTVPLIDQCQASFLSTYEILVPWRVDRRRLGWLMATLLVNRQVLKAVKRLSGGGPHPVERLLEEAAQLGSGRGLQ